MTWNRLDRTQSQQILEHVAIASDPTLFTGNCCEANFKPLPFYEDYMVYRIVNYATLPCFSLDFLSDGESFHLLDGSPSPINLVNTKGSLYLTEANVIDYAEFYLSNINGEDGDIYMIRNIEDLPFLDSLGLDQQRELYNNHAEPQVAKPENGDGFVIFADLFYGGTLLKAGIIVKPSGSIEIQPHDMLLKSGTVVNNKH